ncbi:winged helix DNA-binding domain-containing protein [Microbacterium sp. NPDC008134]|uniref:winged helix DNA-binding domain-containing protein n=1 Tax=Microbacterium sp. NPDC008134 TaxID=3364183 RepID=UPI0036EFA36B
MNPTKLRRERLRSHRLTARAASVVDAAGHMLAVQSQDFTAGRWALAARTRGTVTLAAVDRAFDRGDIVRAWTMRGTLHTIPARDLGWVLSVTGERQLAAAAARHRDLGIDEELLRRAAGIIDPVLRDGGCSRAEAFARWTDAGVDPRDQRGVHLLGALAMRGEICQGPVVPATASAGIAREQRFVASDAWIGDAAWPDDPLAELFVRYVDGHGPARVEDFAWWSGLTLGVSRDARERAAGRVTEIDEGTFAAAEPPRRSPGAPRVQVLGAFDEYYISYADRSLVCPPEGLGAVGPGKNGMVRPVVVIDGEVVGVWRLPPASGREGGRAVVELFGAGERTAALDPEIDAQLRAALARHAAFLGAPERAEG